MAGARSPKNCRLGPFSKLLSGEHEGENVGGLATIDRRKCSRKRRCAMADRSDEKGTATMKLTTTTMVTVDGVMQGLGAPDEDRSGGFERGGWQAPVFDNEARTFLNQVYERADAFLFGRRTYEMWAGYWGAMANPDNPISDALNTKPKYVASTTLTDPKWSN